MNRFWIFVAQIIVNGVIAIFLMGMLFLLLAAVVGA
jgi:hypothetical protein